VTANEVDLLQRSATLECQRRGTPSTFNKHKHDASPILTLKIKLALLALQQHAIL